MKYYTWVNDQNLFEFLKLELMGITMTSEPEAGLKTSFYLLMVYAALISAISSLLTAGYITLYNQGIKFFEQVSLFVFNVNIWPLILLTGAGVLIGLLIKFFGQRGDWGLHSASMPRQAA